MRRLGMRGWRWRATAACVAAVAALAGCATQGDPGAGASASASARASASAGGLSVEVVAAPASPPPGTPVVVTVRATDAHATGAFAYDVRYGDGDSAHNVVPQYCLGGSGSSRTDVWRFTHRYRAGGRYALAVTVRVNCTPTSATARLAIDARR